MKRRTEKAEAWNLPTGRRPSLCFFAYGMWNSDCGIAPYAADRCFPASAGGDKPLPYGITQDGPVSTGDQRSPVRRRRTFPRRDGHWPSADCGEARRADERCLSLRGGIISRCPRRDNNSRWCCSRPARPGCAPPVPGRCAPGSRSPPCRRWRCTSPQRSQRPGRSGG